MTEVAVIAWGTHSTPEGDSSLELFDLAAARGFSFSRLGAIPSQAVVLFVDFHPTKSWKFLREGRARVLLVLEPPAVNPLTHTKWFRRLFDVVICISPEWVLLGSEKVVVFGSKEETFERDMADLNWRERKRLVGFLNSNKMSFLASERYSFRMRVLRELSGIQVDKSLGGAGWSESALQQIVRLAKIALATIPFALRMRFHSPMCLPKSILGEFRRAGRVASEIEFYREHKFALVIENDDSYVSEKLVNAILAGCVPIYSGPKALSHWGLSENCFFRIEHSNPRGIIDAIEMDDDKALMIIAEGKRWLNSNAGEKLTFSRFGWIEVIEEIAKMDK